MSPSTILLLGASLAAAFTWGRAMDRSWRLHGAQVETAWQMRRFVKNEVVRGPNRRCP